MVATCMHIRPCACGCGCGYADGICTICVRAYSSHGVVDGRHMPWRAAALREGAAQQLRGAHLYVCMYVCMYACMHMCMCAHHVCVFGPSLGGHVCLYVCMHAYVHDCVRTTCASSAHRSGVTGIQPLRSCGTYRHVALSKRYVCMYVCMYAYVHDHVARIATWPCPRGRVREWCGRCGRCGSSAGGVGVVREMREVWE